MIWVQFIVFFILGATITAFLMVLFFPFVWRRALYLANKAVRMEIPVSLAEIEVERDFLRAEHATNIARLEELLNIAENRYADMLLDYSKMREHNYDISCFERSLQGLSVLGQQFKEEVVLIKAQLNGVDALPHNMAEIKVKLANVEKINQKILYEIKQLQEKATVKNMDANHNINSATKTDLQLEIKHLLEKNEHLQITQEAIRGLLRKQITGMAAMLVAHIAVNEGKGSPILKLISKTEKSGSLAGLIDKNINNISKSI